MALTCLRPNVLFISVDDMRLWEGYREDQAAKMPHLDRLAVSGVVCTVAYTAYAPCNPSRTATWSPLGRLSYAVS